MDSHVPTRSGSLFSYKTPNNMNREFRFAMNILIENFPPDVTVEEIREFLGATDEIEDILLTDGKDSNDVSATIVVNVERAGATGMAGFINGKFFKERRLSATVMSLLNE